MRLSKQIIGIAAPIAFALGLATTGTASAVPGGTQVEFKIQTLTGDVIDVRTYAVETLIEEYIYFGL